MEDLTGKQLGPYQIISPLGEGGMAAVYKAYHASLDRYVAVKVLPQRLANDPQFVGRFEREARIVANLQHAHILPVFDFGESNGFTYLAMPLLETGTLNGLLEGRPLALQQIRNIVAQVASALDYAHTRGLVHRDVKPSNVLIDQSGNCLLTDFGISKIVESTSQFTAAGGILGTPAYMSPEQAQGQRVDARADLYALGVMLYEMAVGHVPFNAETPLAIIHMHVHDPLPLPRKSNPSLPEEVERVILKALAKHPADRYQTGQALAEALDNALARGAPAGKARKQVKKSNTLVGQGAPRGRQPRRLAVGGVIVAAIILGLIVVGGIAAALAWPRLFGAASQAPASTPAPARVTAPAAVAEAATETPGRTATQPPTPPSAGNTAAPAALSSSVTNFELYDDFNDSNYDGLFEDIRWYYQADSGMRGEQRDGAFGVSANAPPQYGVIWLTVEKRQPLTVINAIEASLLWEEATGYATALEV